jgi:hypothetical protein
MTNVGKVQKNIVKTIGMLFCIILLVLPVTSVEAANFSNTNQKSVTYDFSKEQITIKQTPLFIPPDEILKNPEYIKEAERHRQSLDDPLVLIVLFNTLGYLNGYSVDYGFFNFETYPVDVNLVTELRLPNGQVYGGFPNLITLPGEEGYGMSFDAIYGPNGPYGTYSFSIQIFDALTGNLLDERSGSWVHENPIYRRYFPEPVYS